MKKVALAAQMIEKRIAHADHVIAGIPSERQLAEELGLSRNTVRSAVQQLMEKGTLVRQNNGRLDVSSQLRGNNRRTIGFVAPNGPSADQDQWRESVDGVLNGVFHGNEVTVRAVSYGHWADPAIQEALASFDGIFFITPAEKIPTWLVNKMKQSSCRVVILDQDESASGLPSVIMFPPTTERKLFDHLHQLGHRHIDCINTQQEGSIIKGRISVWREYMDAHGMSGQLRSHIRYRPVESAYQLVRDALESGQPLASALFCTTGPAAIGTMRALHEAGLKIGVDISVCAVNSEGVGRYLIPSLTALESPPRALYLRQASEWMVGGGEWQGPLLIQPVDVPLFEGESTGPAPVSSVISLAFGWEMNAANARETSASSASTVG